MCLLTNAGDVVQALLLHLLVECANLVVSELTPATKKGRGVKQQRK